MTTTDVDNLLNLIENTADCRLLAPSGLPTIEREHIFPDDLARFYALCGGAIIYESSAYCANIYPPKDLVLANPIIGGERGEYDITSSWYIVAYLPDGNEDARDAPANRGPSANLCASHLSGRRATLLKFHTALCRSHLVADEVHHSHRCCLPLRLRVSGDLAMPIEHSGGVVRQRFFASSLIRASPPRPWRAQSRSTGIRRGESSSCFNIGIGTPWPACTTCRSLS